MGNMAMAASQLGHFEMLETAFRYTGIELEWKGTGVGEKAVIASVRTGLNLKTGDTVIEIDPRYFRPTEVNHLQADISKARKQLGWEPRITFAEVIKTMVDYDLQMVGIEAPGEGIKACLEKGFCYTDHRYSLYEKIREGS